MREEEIPSERLPKISLAGERHDNGKPQKSTPHREA
jgi:hypothetical protein